MIAACFEELNFTRVYAVVQQPKKVNNYVKTLISSLRNIVYQVASPVWSKAVGQEKLANTTSTAANGDWSHFHMLAVRIFFDIMPET